MSAKIKPVSAEQVARALVTGIERDRRSITADPTSALMARATSLVAPIARSTMRRAVRKVSRRAD